MQTHLSQARKTRWQIASNYGVQTTLECWVSACKLVRLSSQSNWLVIQEIDFRDALIPLISYRWALALCYSSVTWIWCLNKKKYIRTAPVAYVDAFAVSSGIDLLEMKWNENANSRRLGYSLWDKPSGNESVFYTLNLYMRNLWTSTQNFHQKCEILICGKGCCGWHRYLTHT